MTTPEHLAEFQTAYLAEVEELLGVASARLLAVEAAGRAGGSDPRAVRDLFRALHTVKGLSAMVGVEPVVAVAHRMESALRTADRAGGVLPSGAVDALLEGVRAIEQRVRALADGRAVPEPPVALLDALDALEHAVTPVAAPPAALDLEPDVAARLAPFERDQLVRGAAAGRRALRVDFTPTPERAAQGTTINRVREQLAALGEIVKVVPLSRRAAAAGPGALVFAILLLTAASDDEVARVAGAPPREVSVAPAPAAPPSPPLGDAPGDAEGETAEPLRGGAHVRVEISRLDAAMERLAALIVNRSRLVRAAAALDANGAAARELAQVLQENARLLRELRGAILQIRMVSVADILERVPLLVRRLQRASGKQVKLVVDAGRAELDKAVAERIFPALLHLVRNAVDHGIEAPAERRAAGKPEAATLRIACRERGNNGLELVVEDDGRGVDREALARRAGRAAPQTDAALLDLMCTPGLSSRAEATTTSGRGMGMDIVRRVTVTELGGELELRTRAGQGTTFLLRVPLTVSIVDAFVFECDAQRYVVPVSAVDEIVEVEPARLVRVPSAGAGGGGAAQRQGVPVAMLERRGEAVPLVALGAVLDAARGAAAARGGERRGARKALVVRRNGEPFAFAVDRLVGQQEAVVRPLEDPLVRVAGVAGATDLGDGRPVLVLDLLALGGALSSGGDRAA